MRPILSVQWKASTEQFHPQLQQKETTNHLNLWTEILSPQKHKSQCAQLYFSKRCFPFSFYVTCRFSYGGPRAHGGPGSIFEGVRADSKSQGKEAKFLTMLSCSGMWYYDANLQSTIRLFACACPDAINDGIDSWTNIYDMI